MKLHIALMFGGKSPEHAVSVRSARNIYQAIDRDRFDVSLIGVDLEGKWFRLEEGAFLGEGLNIAQMGTQLAAIPGASSAQIIELHTGKALPQISAVFSIIHGPFGEDGSLQGLLQHLNLPYVGPGVLGSAVAMDKDVSKRLLKEAGLLVADYLVFHAYEANAIDYFAVKNQLGLPLFIKPANMGSSIGVCKADNKEEFDEAVAEAFRYDHKIVVESFIEGRELECAVLGNEILDATGIGEIVMEAGFYDYDSKYISADAAKLYIPAKISDLALHKLRIVAKQAYQVHACEGLARVDMFLTAENDVYVNELNTLPGFTSISMYPKLWEVEGLSYSNLITRLIELAIERHARNSALELGM